MAWLFGSKKKEPAGRWVEDVTVEDYGYGREFEKSMGTYHWEGPEPATGRPQNPAETPEGMLRLQQIRNAARHSANSNARYRREEQQRLQNAEEEKRVCREACDAAIAGLRARRATSGGRRKTRKNSKRVKK